MKQEVSEWVSGGRTASLGAKKLSPSELYPRGGQTRNPDLQIDSEAAEHFRFGSLRLYVLDQRYKQIKKKMNREPPRSHSYKIKSEEKESGALQLNHRAESAFSICNNPS